MDDAAGFFANVFGGERFVAYVSPYPRSPLKVGSNISYRLGSSR